MKRLTLAALLAFAGCDGGSPGVTTDGGTPMQDGGGGGGQDNFIALVADFEGYQQWQHYDLGYEAPDEVHLGGNRTVFINHLPPHGSTTFPLKTIIVKEVVPDDGGTPQVFAMSKRGGDYNPVGAVGWEWLELTWNTDPVVIAWRGISPPANTGYGTIPSGACNHCHKGGAANDFVQDVPLQLTNF